MSARIHPAEKATIWPGVQVKCSPPAVLTVRSRTVVHRGRRNLAKRARRQDVEKTRTRNALGRLVICKFDVSVHNTLTRCVLRCQTKADLRDLNQNGSHWLIFGDTLNLINVSNPYSHLSHIQK